MSKSIQSVSSIKQPSILFPKKVAPKGKTSIVTCYDPICDGYCGKNHIIKYKGAMKKKSSYSKNKKTSLKKSTLKSQKLKTDTEKIPILQKKSASYKDFSLDAEMNHNKMMKQYFEENEIDIKSLNILYKRNSHKKIKFDQINNQPDDNIPTV